MFGILCVTIVLLMLVVLVNSTLNQMMLESMNKHDRNFEL